MPTAFLFASHIFFMAPQAYLHTYSTKSVQDMCAWPTQFLSFFTIFLPLYSSLCQPFLWSPDTSTIGNDFFYLFTKPFPVNHPTNGSVEQQGNSRKLNWRWQETILYVLQLSISHWEGKKRQKRESKCEMRSEPE